MDLVYREKWRQPCRVRLKAYRGQTSPSRPRQTLEAEGQSARHRHESAYLRESETHD